MRTTLTLEEDIAQKTQGLAIKLKRPWKSVINQALRLGLEQIEKPQARQRYRTQARPLGLKKGYSLDNIQELLSQLDEEEQK